MLFLLCFILFTLISAQHPSPCKDIFRYDKRRAIPGQWFGTLNVQSEFPIAGTWIKVILDRKAEQLETNFADVLTTDNKEFLIRNYDYTLVRGEQLKVPLNVKYYAGDPIPSVVSILLNGRTICPVKPIVGISLCPGVYAYNQDKVEDNRWYGQLNLDSEFELKGVSVRIHLDNLAELLGNEFGDVTTTDNFSYLIRNLNYTLIPGRPLRIPFWVKYSPVQLIPGIQTILLNGRTVCGRFLPDDHVNKPFLSVGNIDNSLGQSTDSPMRFAPSTTTEYDYALNNLVSCGTVLPEAVNLIINGTGAQGAQWPWHGAIYSVNPSGLKYICGMSLISEQHAITAAHCVLEDITTKRLRDQESLVLYFGILDRKDFTASHVQRPQIEKLIAHPDYSESEADIAVIKFKRPVIFNQWVRPVCLWNGDRDMRYIVNTTGTVVGFGVTESGVISNHLLYADILVVDTPTCIFSHRDFYSKYTSLNTYCAGNLTQSSACNGDSGGGMVFKRDGTDVYQLRGIVSTAVKRSETELCDYNHYVIFTDAAKYVDWIEKAIAT